MPQLEHIVREYRVNLDGGNSVTVRYEGPPLFKLSKEEADFTEGIFKMFDDLADKWKEVTTEWTSDPDRKEG